ncbi:MAG: hypothetical protein JW966_09655 [Anaerolineae bacterium]|nr:hypothetical protein [Anaerolineae bacterium]
MEKVLQEFRIIETDDGFRIEIKGDKDELRDFVMSLDPRQWAHPRPPFGPPPFMRGRRGKHFGFHFGPGGFGFGPPWEWDEDDEEEGRGPRRKHRHHHEHHHEHGHEHDHEHDHHADEIEHEDDTV